MFCVYVLYSELAEKIYIGFTADIENRLRSHNELSKQGWTIKFRPWKLIHTENFKEKGQAMRREKQLKSAKGREWIWTLIKKN